MAKWRMAVNSETESDMLAYCKVAPQKTGKFVIIKKRNQLLLWNMHV